MKILLVNPPAKNTVIEYPDEKGEEYIESDDFGYFPPLGLLYLLAALKEHTTGHELFFKDCVAERISHEELEKIYEEIQPDVVGITSFTIALVDVLMAARAARRAVPGAHLCLGGHHPIAFPIEAAGLKEFDSIVVGEGEIAFTELIKALEKKEDITRITGVYTAESVKKWIKEPYKDKRFLGHVKVPPAYIEDIDTLPFPDRSFIEHIKYYSIVGHTEKLATVITSRGCPYKCTFCDVPMKRYRKRSAKSVIDEVELCLNMGYKEIHFYDDLFNITPKRVIDICDEIDKRNLKFHWDFRGRVNTATKESLIRAKKSGCRMISFGVETGSDEGLEELQKGTSVEQVQKVFKWCRQVGIRTIADYMIGLPFEKSEQDIMKNVKFLIKLNPTYAQFAILSLYPNTRVYDQAVEKGIIEPGRWEKYSLNPGKDFTVDHWEEYLSIRELVKIQKKAYLKFYLRPFYMLRSFFGIRSWHEFKVKFRGLLKLFG